MALLVDDRNILLTIASPKNKGQPNLTSCADCHGDYCQLWNKEAKDCGLKQQPIAPALTEIKTTLVEISENVNTIRANVE